MARSASPNNEKVLVIAGRSMSWGPGADAPLKRLTQSHGSSVATGTHSLLTMSSGTCGVSLARPNSRQVYVRADVTQDYVRILSHYTLTKISQTEAS